MSPDNSRHMLAKEPVYLEKPALWIANKDAQITHSLIIPQKGIEKATISLDEIGTLLTGGGAVACGQMRDLLQGKLQEISDRMKGLRAFTGTLRRHLQACETELARHGPDATCPIIVEIGYAAN